MKTKPKSILSLLCLLAASGCSTGLRTTSHPDAPSLAGNTGSYMISHYEMEYNPLYREWQPRTVYTREHQIKVKTKYLDQCISGEKSLNEYSSYMTLKDKPWLIDALPEYQIEWLIQKNNTYCERYPTDWKVKYLTKFSQILSRSLEEKKQKEIRTSSLQKLCESTDSDVDQVRSILSLGCDVNAMNENGYPPLHLAVVTNKNVEFATVLLEAGADVTTKCQGGKTALQHAAAENKNPEVFAALLEAGSDVNAKFEGGTSPLHSVVSFNPRVEIVRLLLKYGADVNAKDQQFGITPLHAASAFGTNPEVISVLLYAGANPNLCNKKGQLPLDMARDNDALQGTEALDELTEATSK